MFLLAGAEVCVAFPHHRAHGSNPTGQGHDPGVVPPALRDIRAHLPAVAAAREAEGLCRALGDARSAHLRPCHRTRYRQPHQRGFCW